MRKLRLRRHHDSSYGLVLTAFLAAILVFTVSSVTSPSDVLGASTLSTRCDGVSLRTRPSTSSTRKAVLPSGVQVNAVKKVTGGSWRVRCAGRTYTGNTWYRINNVNGRSASSRYGVSYVYSATALLKPVTAYPKYTACDGVALRAKPSISSTREAVLPVAVKVSVVARVSGGRWIVSCNGKSTTGTSWYRITIVNGRNVTNRYGVTYVYAATALFRATAPTSTPPPTTSTPTPTPSPTTGTSVRVTTVPALLNALDDNAVTDIVVANGTYRVSTASSQQSSSLWIGARYADRTNPVTVRAETRGGVTFDGGGSSYFGGISFQSGAHHQTWDGFNFVNGTPANMSGGGTGMVMFGGYSGKPGAHHITLRNTVLRPKVGDTPTHGHAVYFSWAVGGAHDILIDNMTVDDPNGWVTAAWHFYHSSGADINAWNVTIKNSKVTGTRQAVMLWDATLHDIVIQDTTFSGAKQFAIRYEEAAAARRVTLRRVTSSGSGEQGFFSYAGSNPPGVTFIDSVLH